MRLLLWLVALIGPCSVWADTSACRKIVSPSSLQTVVNAASSSVSICLDSDNQSGNATWSLANENPLLIKANTAVKIDCGGQSIDLRSNNGNMTMERGSSLEYQDCLVVDYDYPDYQSLYGSVHSFKDTLISMDSCQFVEALSQTYAGIFTKTQPNATFLLGELVSWNSGSAVHMFYAAFDSLAGPQVRFVHTNTTAYCFDNRAAVEAARIARENGPVVTVSSEAVQDDVSGISDSLAGVPDADAVDGDDSDSEEPVVPTWFIGIVSVAGVALIALIVMCVMYLRRSRRQHVEQQPDEVAMQTDQDSHPSHSHRVNLPSKASHTSRASHEGRQSTRSGKTGSMHI